MTKKLKLADVKLSQMSWLDSAARIFRYDGKLYRGIFPEQAEGFREIYQKLNKAKLFDNLIVDTKIADIDVEGFDLIFEHHEIQPVSLPPEWSVREFKDSLLCTLEVMIALDKLDLELKDGHPWNTLLENGRFYFIDIGSIQPKVDTNNGIKEIFSYYLFHLLLAAGGHPELARDLWRDGSIPLVPGDVAARTNEDLYQKALDLHDAQANVPLKKRKKYLQQIYKYAAGIDIDLGKTAWGDYRDNAANIIKEEGLDYKDQTVLKILKKYKYDRVLDWAGNIGGYALWAADKGKSSIVVDLDENAIDFLYQEVRKKHLPITALVMDIMSPLTPSFQRQVPSPGQFIGAPLPSPASRFKSDMVLAIAITHHLVFSQNYKFDQIIERTLPYVSRYLAIEYIDRGDIYVEEWIAGRRGADYSWYTYANFKKCLQKDFRILDEIKSHDSSNHPRTIFMCELK